jgi:hypothetical protein
MLTASEDNPLGHLIDDFLKFEEDCFNNNDCKPDNRDNSMQYNQERYEKEIQIKTNEKELLNSCMIMISTMKNSKKKYNQAQCYKVYWNNLKYRIQQTENVILDATMIEKKMKDLEEAEKKKNQWKIPGYSTKKNDNINDMENAKEELNNIMDNYADRYADVLKGNKITKIEEIKKLILNFPIGEENSIQSKSTKNNEHVFIPSVPVFESTDDKYYDRDNFVYAEKIKKMNVDYTTSLRFTEKILMSDKQFRAYELHMKDSENTFSQENYSCSIIMQEVGDWIQPEPYQGRSNEILIDYTKNKLLFTKCQMKYLTKTEPVISMHMFLKYDVDRKDFSSSQSSQEFIQKIMSDQVETIQEKNAIEFFFNHKDEFQSLENIVNILKEDYIDAKKRFRSHKQYKQIEA